MKIGLDFGMTNSSISYYDMETNGLINFQPDPTSPGYIPTIISYNKSKKEEIYIGDAAKANMYNNSFESHENFKLLLGSNCNNIIKGTTKSAIEVTDDFIKKILESFKTTLNKNIDSIVMTVPEIWIRENSNKTARENIVAIFTGLGYTEESFRLESEPVAAAAYFCHTYKNSSDNPKKNGYSGHIAVVDYGGGTLDVTLCKVSNGSDIAVLERQGFGEDNKTNGQAGLAFDEAVTEKIIKDNNLKIPINKKDNRFINLRNKFEEQKRLLCSKITEQLKLYFSDPDVLEGETLFSLVYDIENGNEVNIKCEDLVYCFKEINSPVLIKSLKKIKVFCASHSIDTSSQDHFRILLVGGFCNFYIVEIIAKTVFQENSDDTGERSYEVSPHDIDKRFEQPYSLTNRSFAISRGAALIAQDMISIKHTCPYNIGYIVMGRAEFDKTVSKDEVVIKRDTIIEDLKSAVFSDIPIQIKNRTEKLKIFMDNGQHDKAGRIQIDESIDKLFPGLNDTDNNYKVGFSIDKNLIPSLHITDSRNSTKTTSLNKLFEKFGMMQKQGGK